MRTAICEKMFEVITCRRSALVVLLVIASSFFVLQYIGNHVSFSRIRPIMDMISAPSGKNCQSTSDPDWLIANIDEMTVENMLEYFVWPNRSSCRLAHDFGGHILGNPSGLDGQKAICIEPVQLAPPAGKCLVYSFGINNDWTFDEAMATYGCQVYSFDPSMKEGDHDHTANIHFYQLGLSNRDAVDDNGWRLRTLASIYDMLKGKHGDVFIDYLKMDIEGAEWAIIPQIIESGMMDKVRQLAFEIHLSTDDSLTAMRNRVRTVRSIEEKGMIRFDSKLNPWFHGKFKHLGVSGPCGYEMAWYNNKFLSLGSSQLYTHVV